MFYRYSKFISSGLSWNFDMEKAVERFIDNLFESNSVAEALSRLIREGFGEKDFQLKGIDTLLDELRQLKERYFNQYKLSTAREDLLHRLENMVKSQKGTAELNKIKKDVARKFKPDEYIKKMVDDVKEQPPITKENIKNFLAGMNRYELRFSGNEPLTFEQALELFNKLQNIDDIERSLRNETIDNIDADTVQGLLGVESSESLNTLKHIIQEFESRGYISTKEGRMELTPEGIRRIGEKALRDVFEKLSRDRFGFHELREYGTGDSLTGGTRKFRFGDSFDIDIVGTIKNSLKRGSSGGRKMEILPDDFEILEKESSTRLSTALLIDMSWSMSWGNKFSAAKKVGIAMEELIRTKFPQDKLFIIGFFTVAVELKPYQLPTLDLNVNDPFTNIQDALLLADKLLSKETNSNKNVILITDGQPTAYFDSGILEVEWPVFGISPRSFEKTLQAVHLLTKHNVKINTFMLDTNPVLVQFVEEMMRINRGKAFFTTPEDIGSYLLVDYFEKKRKIIN